MSPPSIRSVVTRNVSTLWRTLTKPRNWNLPLQSIFHSAPLVLPISCHRTTHKYTLASKQTCFMWYFIHCTLTLVPEPFFNSPFISIFRQHSEVTSPDNYIYAGLVVTIPFYMLYAPAVLGSSCPPTHTFIRVLLSCRNSATLLLSCLLLFRQPELLTWTFGKALNVKLLKSPLSRFIPRKTTLPSGCRQSRVNWGRPCL